jgi:hypothetical protein
MLQGSAQAVGFKVGRHFGEGQAKNSRVTPSSGNRVPPVFPRKLGTVRCSTAVKAVEDSSKSALLVRREMIRHVLPLSGLVIFKVGEK